MFKFLKKLNSLYRRYDLIEECNRLKKANKFIPSNYKSLIFFKPSVYEDFIHLLCFLDNRLNTTLIDIGANIGEFSYNFLKFFPNTEKILLFEPQNHLNTKIKENLKNFNNYNIYNVGIGDADEKKMLHYEKDRTYLGSFLEYEKEINSFYKNKNDNTKEVTIAKLDNYSELIKKHKQIVVKIDVQGFEYKAIKGGLKFLKFCDILIMECSFLNEYKNTEPSFVNCAELLKKIDLYPIIFQNFGNTISTYAYERDVIFVKKKLLNKIFYKNY